MTPEELDPGDVVVKTKYSTINYKDALSYNGTGRIMRKFPTVAGIDMAGTVETSADPRFKRGDKVIVHAYDFGVAHDGGYAEYARVPGDWVVRRPEGMTAFDAMTLGTRGFHRGAGDHAHGTQRPPARQRAGRRDGRDRRRRQRGHRDPGEARLSRRRDHGQGGEDRLPARTRGEEVRLRQSIDLANIRALDKATWARRDRQPRRGHARLAAVDDEVGGTAAAVGLAAGPEAQHDGHAVHPARRAAARRRQRQLPDGASGRTIWNKLAAAWRPDRVHDQVRTIDFDDLPTHFDAYLKGTGARPDGGRASPLTAPLIPEPAASGAITSAGEASEGYAWAHATATTNRCTTGTHSGASGPR